MSTQRKRKRVAVADSAATPSSGNSAPVQCGVSLDSIASQINRDVVSAALPATDAAHDVPVAAGGVGATDSSPVSELDALVKQAHRQKQRAANSRAMDTADNVLTTSPTIQYEKPTIVTADGGTAEVMRVADAAQLINASGSKNAVTADGSLQNLIASVGGGTDRLPATNYGAPRYQRYEEMSNMYRGWLGRRICDLVPEEALEPGWEIVCPSMTPEQIQIVETFTEKLELKKKLITASKWENVFGGSLILYMLDARYGGFRKEIPQHIAQGSLMGLRVFDAWEAHSSRVELVNAMSKHFRLPITYTLGTPGFVIVKRDEDNNIESAEAAGTVVHYSRTCRFGGLDLPWYEFQNNWYWGQSKLESAFSAVRDADIMSHSVASMMFRSAVPILKVKELERIVSDPDSRAAFLDRVNLLNYGMSYNNMGIVDAEEELTNLEIGTLSGLDPLIERFYVLVSAATGIPVTKLVGESARGLNATGEGDLKNYYDMVDSYRDNHAMPRLREIYDRAIFPHLFGQGMPIDCEIVFNTLERVSPKDRVDIQQGQLELVMRAMEGEVIDRKLAREEIKEMGIFRNLNEDEINRMQEEEDDNEITFGGLSNNEQDDPEFFPTGESAEQDAESLYHSEGDPEFKSQTRQPSDEREPDFESPVRLVRFVKKNPTAAPDVARAALPSEANAHVLKVIDNEAKLTNPTVVFEGKKR